MALTAAIMLAAGLSGTAYPRHVAEGIQPSAQADATGWKGETGTASYYGAAHNGRLTANGSRFDQTALTAAHAWLPFGTKVRVTLASTGRTVVVTINDRLYSKQRIVDLSLAAAREIGIVHQGLGLVSLKPV